MKKRVVVLVLAAVLVFGCAIGGTLAWLQDKTETIKNTFTVGDVDIDLKEPAGEAAGFKFKMIPGETITKDPTITVADDSEDAYVFVKIEKVNDDENKFLDYAIADGWTELDGVDGVYYLEYDGSDNEFEVLKDNKVTIKGTVSKPELDDLDESTYPTLSFTAYAVQSANIPDINSDGIDATDAWALVG